MSPGGAPVCEVSGVRILTQGLAEFFFLILFPAGGSFNRYGAMTSEPAVWRLRRPLAGVLQPVTGLAARAFCYVCASPGRRAAPPRHLSHRYHAGNYLGKFRTEYCVTLGDLRCNP